MAFSIFKKKEDTFDYARQHVCKNCGSSFQGKFCFRCGEKVVDISDRSFAKMAESLLNAFTFLEGKFWRTFKLLIMSPGKLSFHIRNGVQVPYMRLVGLFFVANFLYFLFPIFDTFNSSLSSQFYSQDYSPLVQELVRAKIKASGISVDDYTERYNAQSGNLAKLLLVLLVFIFTIPLALINYSKKNQYFDHLQLSFEFHAYVILLCSVAFPLLLKVIIDAASWFNLDWQVLTQDNVISKVSLVLFLYFFVRAQRTYYEHTWLVSTVKAVGLSFLVFYTWKVYRLLLFFATYWTM